MNFFCLYFLDDLRRLHLLLDVSIFTTIDDEKEKKINSFKYFWGIVLSVEEKVLNNADSR